MPSEDELIEVLRERFGFKPWVPIVMADIIGEKLKEAAARPVVVPKPPPRLATRTVDWRDRLVQYKLPLLDLKVGGRLHEMVLRSTGKNYSLLLLADRAVKIDKTFDEMMTIGPHLDTVSAIAEVDQEGTPTGFYVLRIADVSWLEEVYAVVNVKEPTLFKQVFIKYDSFAE